MNLKEYNYCKRYHPHALSRLLGIRINKFEDLANEIIAKSTKSEMESWFNTYKTKQVSFVSFKSIETKFKMDFKCFCYGCIIGYRNNIFGCRFGTSLLD